MKKFLAALATALAILPAPTLAAEDQTLTLDDAIELALKNNRLIEQSEANRDAAKWNLSAARRSSGLTLSWSSSMYHVGGRYYRRNYRAAKDGAKAENDQYFQMYGISPRNIRLYPNYNYESSNNFNLRMNVYTGGRLESQRAAARYGLNYADLNLENARQQVKYQASAAYYQVLVRASLVGVQQQAVNLLQEHLRTVEIQYEVGTVAKSDMLATDVQLANTKKELTTAQGNYQTAVAQLNNILGLPIETEIATGSEVNFVPYNLTEKDCLDYAVAHRPDGIAAVYAVKQAAANTDSAKSGYRPNVAAVVQGSMTGESFMKADHGGERWAFGVEMSWNIFENGVTAAQVEQSKAAERRAESQALQQLETIQLEVHSAYIALKTAEKNIETTAAAVSKSEEEFEIAKIRYVEGVDTNLNVMNAQEKVVETRNNYYNALYDYSTSYAQLEKAMGVPVLIDALLYAEAEQEGKSSPKSLEAAQVGEKNFIEDSAKESSAPFERK